MASVLGATLLILVALSSFADAAFGHSNLASSNPALQAEPTMLKQSGDHVTIYWWGLPFPNASDFVAIYWPANSSDADYIGFQVLSESPTWETGMGSMTIQLVNMRGPYGFRLWSCYNKTALVNHTRSAAGYTEVSFANYNEPMQGHLSLTNLPDEMRVMWVTGTEGTPLVEYGLSPDNLTMFTNGSSTTYNISMMCVSPANSTASFRPPGIIHDALLSGLLPDTRYYYRFGSPFEEEGGWSPTYSFRSSPGVGHDIPTSVLAYGDLGIRPPGWLIRQEVQDPSAKTVKWLQRDLARRPYDVLLHIGDISYARGWSYLWELFFHQIQPVSTQVPYMVCIGNHEYDWVKQPFRPTWSNYGPDSGGECGIPYMKRFHMPDSQPGSSLNLWYSFDVGNVHFVLMSTEHDFLVGSEQWNFLQNDLLNVDRKKTPWVVFSGHRPMYTSSALGSAANWTLYFQEAIEPLLVKYKVNLALWGHVHQYERTCAVKDSECAKSDSAAPVHVVIGMAGNQFQIPWAALAATDGTGEDSQPDWSIFRTMSWGYTRFDTNATHLHFQFVGDQRGDTHDEFYLEANY